MTGEMARYYIVDAMTAIVCADPSSITKSFKACGVIETTNSMSKGEISYFYPGVSDAFQARFMKEKYDIDVTQVNVEVITGIDLAKCVKLISTAVKEQGHKKE